MASTWTSNIAIEKIADGEKTDTWGQITNRNFDIVDRAISGVGTISLASSGASHTLSTTDGSVGDSLDDGQYRVLVLTGATQNCTVTVTPNDASKFYFVDNDSGYDVTFSQGTGSNVTVTNGSTAVIYCDGAGSGAAVKRMIDESTLAAQGVTASAAELNILDSASITTTELNRLSGVTDDIQTQIDTKAPSASPTFTGSMTGVNLTLTGNLTVEGDTTTVSTTNTVITDNLISLKHGATGTPTNDAGIIIERGDENNACIIWNESGTKFKLGTTTATASSTGTLSVVRATIVADLDGDVEGNATTATKLETPRTIGGVSFDGTANITLPGVNDTGNQDTAGNAATASALQTARLIAGQSFNGTADISIGTTDLTDVTASAADLNILDGVTATTAELNYNDITTLGTSEASKVVTADANGDVKFANAIVETVYSLTGTALDPNNGTVQTKTISANTTFTDSLSAGESMSLHLTGAASYTITWPTITWLTASGNAAPTLTAADTVVLFKISTTLYGVWIGSSA